MIRPKVTLVDRERATHQRFCHVVPVGGLQQYGKIAQTLATVGWFGPKLVSAMASARHNSGSASSRRLVFV
jgi:hypothetical protein